MNKRMHGTIWKTEDNWKENKRDGFYVCIVVLGDKYNEEDVKRGMLSYAMFNLDEFGNGNMRLYPNTGFLEIPRRI